MNLKTQILILGLFSQWVPHANKSLFQYFFSINYSSLGKRFESFPNIAGTNNEFVSANSWFAGLIETHIGKAINSLYTNY